MFTVMQYSVSYNYDVSDDVSDGSCANLRFRKLILSRAMHHTELLKCAHGNLANQP